MWSVRILLVVALLTWPVTFAVRWIGCQRIVRLFSRKARVKHAAAELVELWEDHGDRIWLADQTMAGPLPDSDPTTDAD